MHQQEKGKRVVNRSPAYVPLGLTMTLAFLAVLFVMLSASYAAPFRAPATNQPECSFSPDGSLTTDELQTTSIPPLLIATSADYWPMEYISGTQIVGHDIDLMNAIAVEMSATVVYTDVAFSEILNGLIAGKGFVA